MSLPTILISLIIMGFITSQQLKVSDYYADISKIHNEMENVELIKLSYLEHYNLKGTLPTDIGELNKHFRGANSDWGKDEFDNEMVLVSSRSESELLDVGSEDQVLFALVKKGFDGQLDSIITNNQIIIGSDDEYYAFGKSILNETERATTKVKVNKCTAAVTLYNNHAIFSNAPILSEINGLYSNSFGLKFLEPMHAYDDWGNHLKLESGGAKCQSPGIDGIIGNQDDVL